MINAYSNRVVGFTKLFSTIIHSTVWRTDMHVKVVWVTLLAMADRNGRIWASTPGLADAARVSLEQCAEALAVLTSPDEWSRTKTDEGRRIKEIDGGWELLNYLKYREMRDEEERKFQTRQAVARHRKKKAAVSHGKPMEATASHESQCKPKQKQKQKQKEQEISSEPSNGSEPLAVSPSLDSSYSSVNALLKGSNSRRKRDNSEQSLMNIDVSAYDLNDTPPVLTFPTVGPSSAWCLSSEQLAEWQGLFPNLDVMAEMRKAVAWLPANPTKRKTAKGMPRFLVAWLTRAVDNGHAPAGQRSVTRTSAAPAPTYGPWLCPHVEDHASQWRCEQATALNRPRKAEAS